MNKYNAQKTEIDGIVFHSKKEADRYSELKLLMHATGKDRVLNVELQPKYPCIVEGVEVCTYIADFIVHYADGRVVVEDVKGYKKGCAYSLFRLKKKLVETLYRIEIVEV